MIVRKSALKPIDFEGLSIFDYTGESKLRSSVAFIEVPPGATHARAWSQRSDKFYLVVAGSLRFTLQGDPFLLESGDFCRVEQGSRFSYENQGTTSA